MTARKRVDPDPEFTKQSDPEPKTVADPEPVEDETPEDEQPAEPAYTGPVFPTARVVDSTDPNRIEHEPVVGQVHGETADEAAARGVDPRLIAEQEEEWPGNSSSPSESSEPSSSEKSPTND